MKDIQIKKLGIYSDENGKVMHMMKCTDSIFTQFGEVYCSLIYPDKIKGWHRNKKGIKNYVVIKGNILLVLYDGEEITEIEIGENNYCMVQIPVNVWTSFKAIGQESAILVDITELPFNPQDNEKAEIYSLTDYWVKK